MDFINTEYVQINGMPAIQQQQNVEKGTISIFISVISITNASFALMHVVFVQASAYVPT